MIGGPSLAPISASASRPPRPPPLPRSPGARCSADPAGRRSRRLGRIDGGEQPSAERSLADPPAGIDARPEQEAKMPAIGRALEARGVISARRPTRSVWRSAISPFVTNARFSPVSATMSQTVPSATSSRSGSRSGSSPAEVPAPKFAEQRHRGQECHADGGERCPCPETSSRRLGLTIAKARRQLRPTWW